MAQPLATNASNGLHRLVPSFPPLGLAFPVFATENEDNHPLRIGKAKLVSGRSMLIISQFMNCFQNGPNQAMPSFAKATAGRLANRSTTYDFTFDD